MPTIVTVLDTCAWTVATDPDNRGVSDQWYLAPRADAAPTPIPWIIQGPFPGYHGVAWYHTTFAAPDRSARTLLRFWAVDYAAHVWLNGQPVGTHEGAESPFVLDVTDAVADTNVLAVRVVNPCHEPIDGLLLSEIPHRNTALPYRAGSAWAQGGIMDSVELLHAPTVRLADVFVQAGLDGTVRVKLEVDNAGRSARGRIELAVALAHGGESVAVTRQSATFRKGVSTVEATLTVPNPRRWELAEPNLYRLTARLHAAGDWDELSTRFGFREFRFEHGCFRLNGKRLYLKCSHTGNCCPVGLELPLDPDWLRRDLVNVKAMGFNAIRFIAGVAKRYQLDLCDELGLMVYEESYAGWCLGDSPRMAERYDESLLGMIRRDRNHPCITIWGLLNETPKGQVFQHALATLPNVRELDPTRLVILNSGDWHTKPDAKSGTRAGSLSNPGGTQWEDVLSDQHPYQPVPHTAEVIATLRELQGGGRPVFVSEYGVGSAIDLWRVTRWYEQLGATEAEDARFYRTRLDCFMDDWEAWRMESVFGRPEDYFAQCLASMADLRRVGLTAIRANPDVIGHSLTGTVDQGMSGEGLFTTFRELKPGTLDALFESLAPLRFCLFAEPPSVYVGSPVRLEAVLAHEDQLRPGKYRVRLATYWPENRSVREQWVRLLVPAHEAPSAPFAVTLGKTELVKPDQPGTYRFVAEFESGAAPACGTVSFAATDPASLPVHDGPVVLWGNDERLRQWLDRRDIPVSAIAWQPGHPVLVGAERPESEHAFDALWEGVERGSVAIFLCPEVFVEGEDTGRHLPFKGKVTRFHDWLYHKDVWARPHPIFDGLPTGLLDQCRYRDLISSLVIQTPHTPDQVVCAAHNTSLDYASGVMLGVWRRGEGRIVICTLRLRDNLDELPEADRILLNLLSFAASP